MSWLPARPSSPRLPSPDRSLPGPRLGELPSDASTSRRGAEEPPRTDRTARGPNLRALRCAPIPIAIALLTSACGDGDVDTAEASEEHVAPGDSGEEATRRAFPQSIASGDPRETSVVLWTRISEEVAARGGFLELDLSPDPSFSRSVRTLRVTPREQNDFVVKARVAELEPGTAYYYRFDYHDAEETISSHVGTTRTAPGSDTQAPARFAFFSCQDFEGRYYNSYAHLLERYTAEDLDFVVFLGDYVYETAHAGEAERDRSIGFQAPDGAIALDARAGEVGSDAGDLLAARSLSNYRDLYRQYRSDPELQRLHERFPMIAIWDDHEFSDDSWQDSGNYFAGRVSEIDSDRKKNAERAFFEYMPIEVGIDAAAGEMTDSDPRSFEQASIYRSFHWGAQLELILTDYRSFRPDHLIAEDAFPGAIAMPEGETLPGLDAYVAIDDAAHTGQRAALLPLLEEAYQAEGLAASEAAQRADDALRGPTSVAWLDALYEAATHEPLFDDSETATLPRGVSFASLGKSALFSSIGSRYAVRQDLYQRYARWLSEKSGGQLPDVLGGEQEAWLHRALSQSDAAWTVVASSVSWLPLMLDFTHPLIGALLPNDFPESLRQPMQLNSDQWDGFPLKKQQLLASLGAKPNTVIISGDIHSSFVGAHNLGRESLHPVFEFTGTAVSSATMAGFVEAIAESFSLGDAELLTENLGSLFRLSAEGNSLTPNDSLDYANTSSNGYVVVEAGADALTARYHHYPSSAVFSSYYEASDALMDLFEEEAFVVSNGVLRRQ